MGSYSFELRVFGGSADDAEPKVPAERVADALTLIAQDASEVCKNLADNDPPLDGKGVDCRVFVTGPPQKGASLSWPCLAEAPEDLPRVAMRAYGVGLRDLRDLPQRMDNASLPRGLDIAVLKRARGVCQSFSDSGLGLSLDLPAENGSPPLEVPFDKRLRAAIDLKLDILARAGVVEDQPKPDMRVHGFSVQGVLYALSDPDYENDESRVSFEINPQDGTSWVCHMEKRLYPGDIKELFKTEVLVTGVAVFRPMKNQLTVESPLVPIPSASDPGKALDRLIELMGGLDEPVQDFMDRVRERD